MLKQFNATPAPFFQDIFPLRPFALLLLSTRCRALAYFWPGGESRRDLGTAGREIQLNFSDETSGEAVGKNSEAAMNKLP